MSLKKRMFRSNMAILFLALLSLLVIMMVVLVTFEDSIEENFLTVEQSRLDRQAMEVFSLADQTDFEGIGDLSRRTWISDGGCQGRYCSLLVPGLLWFYCCSLPFLPGGWRGLSWNLWKNWWRAPGGFRRET